VRSHVTHNRVLALGRTQDGLWFHAVDLTTETPTTNAGTVDTWGYVLNALHTWDLAEGRPLYEAEIRRVM
jgi:hypothetical protein